jgi:glucose-1-phosphate cytidylyltransferase
MKVVIFAGGKGTRILEESTVRPKPMVEIGGRPILWHILKLYAAQGFNEFVICLGYKGYLIKEYFINYFYHRSDITVDLGTNHVQVHASDTDNFKVTLVDTGLETQTAGRLLRVKQYLGEADFMLTYGDGLADIDLRKLLAYHQGHRKLVTMTAIQPGSRFGVLALDAQNNIRRFNEKPVDDGNWVNGGFFVVNQQALNYIPIQPAADDMPWERQPLEKLAADGQLVAYKHTGFWKCMDTLRDAVELNELWAKNPQWKVWP